MGRSTIRLKATEFRSEECRPCLLSVVKQKWRGEVPMSESDPTATSGTGINFRHCKSTVGSVQAARRALFICRVHRAVPDVKAY